MAHEVDPVDLFIFQGGSIKAVGDDGEFEGYLMRWGSPGQTDVSVDRDYFTRETELGRAIKAGTLDVYYGHALPEISGIKNALADTPIGETTEAKADDEGLWIKGQLDLRKKYVERLYREGIKAGQMGLSSGAVSHLVRRERQANGSNKVVRWPVYEASITPTPAEPRTSVYSVKTLMQSNEGGQATWTAELKNLVSQASELIEAGRRFSHLPDIKAHEVKALRASCDELLRRHQPMDDEQRDAIRRRAEAFLSRFGTQSHGDRQ
jgi:phage head maturation protease